MDSNLGAATAGRGAAHFIGRDRELALIEGELTGADAAARAILVHGPGGIGKSALLREAARRAAVAGFAVRWIEGRELPPVPDALEDALTGVREQDRPLVVIDTFERIAAIEGYLRRAVLPSLPAGARAIVAGREPPESAWLHGGWEEAAVVLELDPLPEEDALDLLRAHGLASEKIARDVVAWARGSPLALTLAAGAARADADWQPGTGLQRPEIVHTMTVRLVEADIHGPHLATLGAAAIARVVTGALLRDVAPDLDPASEIEWLAGQDFVEPLGEGVALHQLVRTAIRGDLHRRDPELERELRRRIADHLYERAMRSGGLLLSIDLAHLAESAGIRWGFSWDVSGRYRVDDARTGDRELIRELLKGTLNQGLWPATSRFLAEAPQHLSVVRDGADRLCGYTVAVTPLAAPAFCFSDPLLGPRLEHARGVAGGNEAVVWRDVVDFTGNPLSGVIGMLGLAGVLRATKSNPRFAYLPINPRFPGAPEFAATLGARHLRELDAELDGELIQCHLVDYGPGGLLTAQRDLVYREQGLAPPPPHAGPAIPVDAVREALRSYHVPSELARNELATGAGVEARARSVRGLITEALEGAFGDGTSEELLRRVLIRGYLDPAPSHELAADELNLSRSTYFRRLKAGAERVADYIAAASPAAPD